MWLAVGQPLHKVFASSSAPPQFGKLFIDCKQIRVLVLLGRSMGSGGGLSLHSFPSQNRKPCSVPPLPTLENTSSQRLLLSCVYFQQQHSACCPCGPISPAMPQNSSDEAKAEQEEARPLLQSSLRPSLAVADSPSWLQALLAAAGRGDAAEIKRLLAAEANPNALRPWPPGETRAYRRASPLSLASAGGHLAAVQALLAGGARVDLRLHGDYTALSRPSTTSRRLSGSWWPLALRCRSGGMRSRRSGWPSTLVA